MKNIFKNLFCLIIFCFAGVSLVAQQNVTVTGSVYDTERGDPIPGVTVLEKNTSNGVATDFDGNFSITVPPNATLVFSSIGFESQEIPVNGQTSLNVSLSFDTAQLDEVIVLGYGSLKKSDLTGSVASIEAETIQATPALNIENAIQGQAAGVFVTSTDGAPGSGATIRIRGGNSVTAGNEPLYVIDGFIGGGNLNTINPQDIKSIEILKDASAKAIYGSRGANGVILITTKRGSSKGVFNVNIQSGVQIIPNFIDLLNGQEYAELVNEGRVVNGEEPIYANPAAIGKGTDWQEVISRTGYTQNLTLNFNGGSKNTKVYLSGNLFNQEGVIKETGFRRYQSRANIDHRVSDNFKIGTTTNISYIKREQEKTGLGGVLRLNPADPVFDENGDYVIENSFLGTFFANPISNIDLVTAFNTESRILSTIFAEWEFLPGLNFRSSFSADVSTTDDSGYFPGSLPLRARNQDGGFARINQGKSTSVITEGLLNYDKEFNENHSINAVLGITAQRDRSRSNFTSADELFTDVTLFDALEFAAPDQVTVSSGSGGRQLLSYLGRVNYTLANKYLFTLTGRSDGSSVFGANNKRANFGAAAIGWNLGREQFIKNLEVFDTFKLRASWGQSGNQGINPFQTLGSLSNNTVVFNNVEYVGVTQNRLPNPDLKWERTDEWDIGLEMGFLNNRLRFELDYYKKTTNDLLLNVDLPFQVGFSSQLQNVGKVENEGFEFSLSSNIVNTDNFQFDLSLNISTNENAVVSLADGVEQIIIRRTALPFLNPISALEPGEPIGAFLGLDYLGVWRDQAEIDNSDLEQSQKDILQPGDQKYADHNGDGLINNDDSHVIGNPNPDFFGGLNANLRYKNFTMDLFLQGSYGNDLYSLDYQGLGSSDDRRNNYRFVVDRWTPTNQNTAVPRVNATRQIFSSTADVHDGSFLRLKTLRFGYDLPLDSNLFEKVNLYIVGTNLALLKSDEFLGYDPEVNNSGSSTLQRGFYAADYPQNRSFTIGIDVRF